ncbi:MAG: DEAD/DEAH box helicase, partial [Verrucomicrobiales bacterium]
MNGLEFSLSIPDLWQQVAVRALKDGLDVVVDAPTGAGKTWVFELFVKEWRGRERQAVYTVPTRALANDKWSEWRSKGWDVGIATGDLAENLEAPVVVATLETQRERLLMGNGPALLVVDEYQMMGDRKRGLNYEVAIALAPIETQLLLLSGSVGNPLDVAEWLRGLGREVSFVQEHVRPVPLDEMPVEMLPKVPGHLKAVLVRAAAGALLGELTPLLIFAPQRAAAEKLAKKVAAALPQDDPVELPDATRRALGKDQLNLLKSRVAYHHSGLSYAARAGVIEPLAKAGQLRVIVATTGLAAGINFSVRSVLISDVHYNDGPFLRELESDELLQMFGRAGRRGLDDQGFVITTNKSPRIMDAVQKRLIRVNEIDWPTLMRVMDRAVRGGREPLPAAVKFCGQLFSKQKIRIGIEADSAPGSDGGSESPFELGPQRDEILCSAGRWEEPARFVEGRRELAKCQVYLKERWRPALRSAELVDNLGGGNLCKIKRPDGRGFDYGKEIGIGNTVGDQVRLSVSLRKSLGLSKDSAIMGQDEFERGILPRLLERLASGCAGALKRRGERLVMQVAFGNHPVDVLIDSDGRALVDPPRRRVALEVETSYHRGEGGRFDPPAGSAAHAWRKLGLVDQVG